MIIHSITFAVPSFQILEYQLYMYTTKVISNMTLLALEHSNNKIHLPCTSGDSAFYILQYHHEFSGEGLNCKIYGKSYNQEYV